MERKRNRTQINAFYNDKFYNITNKAFRLESMPVSEEKVGCDTLERKTNKQIKKATK